MNTIDEVLTPLHGINWNDTGSILRGCSPVFAALTADRRLLHDLLARLTTDDHLSDMCEGFDFMRKLVLHDAADLGVRLRLHVYREGFFDRPHNHRWSFASHILRGGYLHRIFGRDDQFGQEVDPDSLQAIHERHEFPGSSYALHHRSVHSVHAEADTISLLVRGPAAKDRFLIIDSVKKDSFWAYGAVGETAEQQANKRLTREQLRETVESVENLLTAPFADG